MVAGCQKEGGEAAPAKGPASKAAATQAAPESKAPATEAAPESKAAAPAVDYRKMFQALPDDMPSGTNPITEEKVALGRMLYFEKRISKNHDISCNSCHDLAKYGVDNEATSPGHKGQRGDRNSPTVYNAAGHLAQFWDGRAADVEAQAKGPVLNPVEMAMPDEAKVLEVLSSMPEYVEAFKKAFPDEAEPVTYDNFARAVGAFERKLVTPSRFDQYLKGDDTVLTNLEKQGLKLYVETGCTTCHNGAYLGGMMYQKLGLVKAWPELKDEGRSKVTGNEAEKYFFKVPSLRNIAKTGPYLHDGSVKDLKTMVSMMAEYQLGRTLEASDVEAIVAFLESTTGPLPLDYIKAPELPKSTDKTPKPDPS
ncbi:MAG: c-type cytochrome [Myxococcales bacterium]|nr:c-type cytochrome [Myxococcales bacterium]